MIIWHFPEKKNSMIFDFKKWSIIFELMNQLPTPPVGTADPDFANTGTMLSVLSKADIKLKSAAAAAQADSR